MGEEAQDRVVRAMADIQRRSLEAAGALVERLITSVDGAGASAPAEAAPDPSTEVVEGWSKLWRDSITSLAAAVGEARGPAAPTLQVGAGAASAALVVEVGGDGLGEGELWVHNPTDRAVEHLRPRCGALLAHDGTELEATAVGFDPAAFDLPARSSRGVRLTVKALDAPAGSFRGVLLVEGLPEGWLALDVRVPGPSA